MGVSGWEEAIKSLFLALYKRVDETRVEPCAGLMEISQHGAAWGAYCETIILKLQALWKPEEGQLSFLLKALEESSYSYTLIE